jgi:D-ribose pyranase
MKKSGILNSDISRVLSYMGHTDTICIGDCGLPIPDETERIDLAVRFGSPSFMEVLEVVAEDMVIESVILAEEIKTQNPAILSQIQELIKKKDSRIELQFVSHMQLKEQTKQCKAILRSGETTPYANIILASGCIFA